MFQVSLHTCYQHVIDKRPQNVCFVIRDESYFHVNTIYDYFWFLLATHNGFKPFIYEDK